MDQGFKINKKWISIILAIVIGILVSVMPPFKGLSQAAMIYIGTFIAVLILLLAEAIPDWAAGLGALVVLIVTRITTIPEAFAYFGQSTIWLIIAIFAFATGIGNSGLINRIALRILSLFPANYRGQVLSLLCTGLVISPLIPSNNAKVNILVPIATSVSEQVGFKEHSKGALGLFSATYMTSYIGANAFFSGSLNVPTMIAFLPVALKAQFTWMSWLSATWVWLVVIIIGTYIYCMTYCKPKEDTNLPPGFIKERLQALGPMSAKEKMASVVLLLALAAWITQPLHGVDAGVIGLIAVIIMAVLGVLTSQDIIAKIPWTLIIFLGSLLSIANYMTVFKVNVWLSALLGPFLAPIVGNVWIFVPVLCLIVYAMRMVIISQLATFTILFAIFMPLLPAAKISPFILVFVIFMTMTTWNYKAQNPWPLATIAIAGGKYVAFEDFRKTSYAYMIMCIVGFVLSIPLWKILGLC